MTNKPAAMQTSTSGKAKSGAAKSFSANSKLQLERRLKNTKKVHPAKESCETASTKWREFPNEAFRASVDNNTGHVIDTSAEPYLVPITTKTAGSVETRGDQASKAKKVALLPKTVQTSTCESLQSDWESFVRTRRPIPPPKIVSKRGNSCKELTQRQNREQKKDKISSSKRRDLAYLVVELDHSKSRERKKGFDDLDAELGLKTEREERSSLTRSNTVSVSREQQLRHSSPPQVPSTMNIPTTRLHSPSSHKRGLGKQSPDSSLSGFRPVRGEKHLKRPPSGQSTESGGTADSANLSDLSSDAFLSSVDSSSDSKYSPASRKKISKQGACSEPKKRRAPPPPPPVTPPPPRVPSSHPPPPTNSLAPHTGRSSVMSDSNISRAASLSTRRLSDCDKKSMIKSSSATQLRGTRPPARPPPPLNKPQLKETKSVVSTSPQKPHTKVRPLISNPHLISSTKTIPSTPVTGVYRSLPSPPPIAESAPAKTYFLLKQDKFENDRSTGHYEDIDFAGDPTPVPPPRRKRTKSKSSPSVMTKQSTLPAISTQVRQFQAPRRSSGTPSLSLVRNRLAQLEVSSSPSPEPSHMPEDYLQPTTSLSGEMKDSDEDEPVGDYVDMGPGILPVELGGTKEQSWMKGTEVAPASESDNPDDCYVDMQPVRDPFEEDNPDPVYEFVDPKSFIKPPPDTKESLYYAAKDLFTNRPDLKVPSSKNAKKKKSKP